MIFYTGNSMKGVFVPGDTLELETVPFSELRPGDIVAIDAERPYVHRVIRIEKGRIITQGDNNPHPDEQPLTPDRSFQKVTGAAAFDGSPRRFRSGENGITDFRHHQRRRRFRTALLAVSRNIGRVFSRRFELRDRLDFKGASAMGASASSSPAEVRRARSVSANCFAVFFPSSERGRINDAIFPLSAKRFMLRQAFPFLAQKCLISRSPVFQFHRSDDGVNAIGESEDRGL